MNRRSLLTRILSAIIAMILVLQIMMPAELINASELTEDSEITEVLENTDDLELTETSEIIDASDVSDIIPSEADFEILDEAVNTETEGTSEKNGEDIKEYEDVPDNDSKAKVTVMLYCVGSNLEGDSMAATVDILEIMEGIYLSGTDSVSVNFIVETGGVDTGLKNRNRNGIISDRRNKLDDHWNSVSENVREGKKQRYLERYDYVTGKKSGFSGISWKYNERYLISANKLIKTDNQPKVPNRLMTSEDTNKANPELAEFIETTKESYPADQYMLILWDHGAGPLGGLGHDERDSSGNRKLQAWNIAPTMEAAGVSQNDIFAYVNYDACLMGNLENALAWSPYAYYYCGSEELEPNDGDFYEDWVSYLCKEAAKGNADFKNTEYAKAVMENVGKINVESFYEWYSRSEDKATKSLIKLGEIDNLAKDLSEYAKVLSELFTVDPIETYYAVFALRGISQDFGGRDTGILDISDFALNMKDRFGTIINKEIAQNSDMQEAIGKLKQKTDKLIDSEKKAVVLSKNTKYFELYRMGGLTMYMPYLSLSDNVSEYMKKYGSIKATDSINDYRTFVGTFCAIQLAGKQLAYENNEKDTRDLLDSVLEAVLESYGRSEIYTGKLTTVPDKFVSHRIQQEGAKISKDKENRYYYKRRDFALVFDILQGPNIKLNIGNGKVEEHFLGYLTSCGYKDNGDGETLELINYAEKKWFGFRNGENRYIPVSIYRVDKTSDGQGNNDVVNPFTEKMYVQIPVLLDGKLHMLDVLFDENYNEGTLKGIWPFDFGSRVYGRYMEIDKLKGKKVTILADVPNALEGEKNVEFNEGEPDGSILGEVQIDGNTKLIRGIQLCGSGNQAMAVNGGTMGMRYFIRDLFGSFYNFEEIKEKVKASFEARDGKKAKGSVLDTKDIGMKITGQKGDEYTDSAFTDLPVYYRDENGQEKELIEKDGKYYTEENDTNVTADTAEDILSGVLVDNETGKVLKEFKLENDTTLYVKPADVTIEKINKIDGATEDLEKYFNVDQGTLEVTVKVANIPGEGGKEQFTNKSKEHAKQAMICDIEPVTYTGRSLLTTQSTGNGSKVIDLTLYSEDGKTILKEGVDYTVSYKNNKNAAAKDQQKNPPTLIINGKGDYKGMKYEAVYTINKADMSSAVLTFDKYFVPLNNKGISLKTTALLPSGIKIPPNQMQLHYYGSDGTEISMKQFADMYVSGKKKIPVFVRAEAIEGAKNIVGKSVTDAYPKGSVIYAYPKSSGSLKVTLSSNKVSLKDGMSGYDFLTMRFKKANLGKNQLGLGELQFQGVYYDKTFTRRVEDDMLTTSGTCYIAVSLTGEKQSEYGNYTVLPIKINVTDGIKLKKGNVTLEQQVLKVEPEKLSEGPVPVTLVFAKDFSWDKLTLTCSTRDGGKVEKIIYARDMKDNKILIDDINNNARGNYTIRIDSAGMNTGSLNLSYKITL